MVNWNLLEWKAFLNVWFLLDIIDLYQGFQDGVMANHVYPLYPGPRAASSRALIPALAQSESNSVGSASLGEAARGPK